MTDAQKRSVAILLEKFQRDHGWDREGNVPIPCGDNCVSLLMPGGDVLIREDGKCLPYFAR